MSLIIPANSAAASGGYAVDNSCRFNSGSNDFLNKTNGTPTNSKKFTTSVWIKRSKLGEEYLLDSFTDSQNKEQVYFRSDDNSLVFFSRQSNSTVCSLRTSRLFRDTSAWYNIIMAIDTTQGTASNRFKIYVNGVQETSFATETYPNQNVDFHINTNNKPLIIGEYGGGGSNYNGYISEYCLIDGQQLDPTSFGEFDEDSGIWKPINVSGLTFGNNGFYLDFEDSSALGNDANGSNNFTVNNLTATDQSTDTCTNNFATLNPLGGSLPLATFSDGNLTLASNTASAYQSAIGTIAIPTTGNWYWEYKVLQTTNGSSGEGFIGVALESSYNASSNPQKLDADGIIAELSGASGGSNFDAGDIASVEVDRTNNTLKIFKNGSSTASLTKTSLPNEIIFPYVTCFGSGTASVSANFGSPSFAISSGNQDGNGYGNFEYAVPANYYCLNSKNLAEYG